MGNTLVNVAAGAISASIAREILPGALGFGLGVLVMTFLLLVIGEITPKTFARYNNEKWVVLAAPVLAPITFLAAPLARVLEGVSLKTESRSHLNRDEIIALVEMARGDGVVGEEALVAGSLLSLGDRRCQSVMVPRREATVMRKEWSLATMQNEARANPYMKYPLVEGPGEEVKGMIHVRDLLGAGELLVRDALFFPETAPLDETLRELLANRGTLGVVVDEYGDWSGIVTESDVLAKAVFGSTGAQLPAGVTRRRDGFLVPAGLSLASLGRMVGETPESRWAESCGGLVEEISGRIPATGECFRNGNLEFRIESSSGRRVNHILVRRVTP
jgi:CBS domain containing-hemolysin-like protein